MTRPVILVTLGGMLVTAHSVRAQQDDGPSPEMKRLSYLVGRFMGTTKVRQPDGSWQERAASHFEGQWIASSTFVEVRRWQEGRQPVTTLYGYDRKAQTYRRYSFVTSPEAKPIETAASFDGDRFIFQQQNEQESVRITSQPLKDAGFRLTVETREKGGEWVRMQEAVLLPEKGARE